MSISSTPRFDRSASLAKEFAGEILFLMGEPAAISVSAEIPLENLFRLLEMYRYDAFSDECKPGVLDTGRRSGFNLLRRRRQEWHVPIVAALDAATVSAYPPKYTKGDVVDELQLGLRDLANRRPVDESIVDRVRRFFVTFEAQLA